MGDFSHAIRYISMTVQLSEALLHNGWRSFDASATALSQNALRLGFLTWLMDSQGCD